MSPYFPVISAVNTPVNSVALSCRYAPRTTAKCENAIVQNGIVQNAIVQNDIVQNAIVQNAIVRNAIVRNAIVRNAIVRNAILRNAIVRNAIVRNAPGFRKGAVIWEGSRACPACPSEKRSEKIVTCTEN